MKFGAKYDIITVFSARLHLDNSTLPEYNSVKQSSYVFVPFGHVQSHTGFHSGALGLSIGRFCRAYDHARKHPDRRLPYIGRLHVVTGLDHALQPEQITNTQRY